MSTKTVTMSVRIDASAAREYLALVGAALKTLNELDALSLHWGGNDNLVIYLDKVRARVLKLMTCEVAK